jgi:hypothetical protein
MKHVAKLLLPVRVGPGISAAVIPAVCLLFAATLFAQDVTQQLNLTRPPLTGSAPVYESLIVSQPISPAVPTFAVILLPGGDGNIGLISTVAGFPIMATAVTANVLTVTVNNSLTVGQQVYLQGTSESFLNGQAVIVASLIGSGPVYTGFTANFTASNYNDASDNGTVSTTPSAYALDINSNNFLVRSRWLFAGQSFYVITLDSASDFQLFPDGLKGQQGSAAHVSDVLQAINFVRSTHPNLPVWLVGTSRGTAGAFVAGANPPPAGPDGLIFSDSINSATDPDSLLMANLAGIRVPVLLLEDAGNTCAGTLASGNAAVVKLLTSSPLVNRDSVAAGGLAPLSDDCNALSDHGFFGKDQEAVTKIAAWIEAAPYI